MKKFSAIILIALTISIASCGKNAIEEKVPGDPVRAGVPYQIIEQCNEQGSDLPWCESICVKYPKKSYKWCEQ